MTGETYWKNTVKLEAPGAVLIFFLFARTDDKRSEFFFRSSLLGCLGAHPEPQATPTQTEAPVATTEAPVAEVKPVEAETKAQPVAAPAATASQIVDVKVPDIGVEKALVAEVLVKVGDQIEPEQSIVVVESDKATVEVPSSVAGIVEAIQIKEGDSIKEGVVLIQVKTASLAAAPEPQATPTQTEAPVATTEVPVATNT